MRTIRIRNTVGCTPEKTGERIWESHSDIPASGSPMKEPSPMMEAMKRKVGQLTALTASPQSRIFSPSTVMKFMRNSAISGGMQLLILLRMG